MRLLAPGKINLLLRVAKPRADGFHPLESWMVTVGLFDNLNFERAHAPGIHLRCDTSGLGDPSSNLVWRAATAFAEALARAGEESVASVGGASVELLKRIPVGAGLGGGSSDGARTLMALNKLWHANWSNDRLATLAAKFGSDLSFFFAAPSALCTGRGEVVTPLPRPRPQACMLVLPGTHMPTPAVYRQFDTMGLGTDLAGATSAEATLRGWASLPAEQLLPKLVNDLELPAFAIDPSLGRLRSDLEQTLGRIVRMSGSGSSLFTLFDDLLAATEAAGLVESRHATRALAVELCPELRDEFADDRATSE